MLYKTFSALSVAAMLSLLATSTSASMLEGVAGDGTTSLIYDSLTGELSIEAESGAIAFVELTSPRGDFTGETPTYPAGIALSSDTDNLLGFASFAGAVINQGGTFSMGTAAAAGLSLADVLADWTFTWNPGPGQPNVFGDLVYLGGDDMDPLSLPDGSTIDLQPAFDDRSGFLADILTANAGVTITGATVTNNSTQEILGASFDSDSVDGLIDLSLARFFAPGTTVDASLVVNTSEGDLNYTLTAVVPEPATLGLLGLGLVGLVGLRRRG